MFAPYFPIEEKRRKRASDWHFQFWTLSFVGVWELHAKLSPSVPRRRGSPNFHLISASTENLPGPKTRTISAQIKYGKGSAFTNLSGSLKKLVKADPFPYFICALIVLVFGP